jgi:hypothetical protein
MPADEVEANQWQEMLRDWRALPAWEIVVTVPTLVMARQHFGLAVAAAAHRPGRGGSDAARGQDPLHQFGWRHAPASVRDHRARCWDSNESSSRARWQQ